MADTFGAVEIPVSASDDPRGDPALKKVADFMTAVLNAYAGAAWTGGRPRADANQQLCVRGTFTHDPTERSFNDSKLPALFLWRSSGQAFDHGDGDRRSDERWTGQWIFPPDTQEKHTPRRPFGNAVVKVIDNLIERGRDPSWFDPGDTDPTAPSFIADVDSIVTAAATSTSPRTVSGAGLNGAIGGASMSPRREVTVTASVAPGAYSTAPIIIVCEDWYGREREFSVSLSANGGQTIGIGEDVVRVIEIREPAHVSTAGSISFGTAAVVGRGSVLLKRAGLDKLELSEWRPGQLRIDVLDAEDRPSYSVNYDAVTFTLVVHESSVTDLDDATRFYPHDDAGRGLDFDVLIDGLNVTSASLPDADG